jgi:uncharacterized membrane protein SirB2
MQQITHIGKRRFSMYPLVKYLHISMAILTILGFVLRGLWMLTDSDKLELRIVRVAPHIIDTVFLLSGIALIVILQLPVFQQPWLLVKFAALLAYIVLGTIALRRGQSKQARTTAFVFALIVFAYIVGVALTKSVASWTAMI